MSLPFDFFELRVVRTRRISPALLRVTFGGKRLADFVSGGRDQRFKLFLPHPGQERPLVPVEAGVDWFPVWRAMDPAERAVMRSYTVRQQRPAGADGQDAELDVDFAMHGEGADEGPATRWARFAGPGDHATLLGPLEADNGGVDFRPPDSAEWILLSGDESALPAVAGILEWLPAGTRVRAWLEVPHRADVQELETAADAEISWLVRDESDKPRTDLVLEALRAAQLPPGTPYAWIAGESGTVKALRRHLVREREFDRRSVVFTGYWRLGATDDQLVEEALAG
ncbi:siderophore-interacting protein [Streptomyces boncukensis]|uniref:Siderophore-interacting protein n=1 Tax=Streptomyces boncukensis TaxID=2711219 RepID=A0A6G4X696_9ACTN|nr:siderophore-interacting protein [Streptomyces boncukensis]NGO72191.1 siderophore-interacting protein [Streptomyces boncukensis]